MSVSIAPECYRLIYGANVSAPQTVFPSLNSFAYADLNSDYISDHSLWYPTSDSVVIFAPYYDSPTANASACFIATNGGPLSKPDQCVKNETSKLASNDLNIYAGWPFSESSYSFIKPTANKTICSDEAYVGILSRKAGWNVTGNASVLHIPTNCMAPDGLRVSESSLVPIPSFDNGSLADSMPRAINVTDKVSIRAQVSAATLAPLNTTTELLQCLAEMFIFAHSFVPSCGPTPKYFFPYVGKPWVRHNPCVSARDMKDGGICRCAVVVDGLEGSQRSFAEPPVMFPRVGRVAVAVLWMLFI